MIRKLQNRFIRIAMVTLTVAMVLVVGVVNVANWISVRGELYDTLHLLVQTVGPTDMMETPFSGAWGGNNRAENQETEKAGNADETEETEPAAAETIPSFIEKTSL